MWKILGCCAVLGAATVLASPQARAMPLTPAVAAAVEDGVTLVRDGCGRGYRFSNRRGGCVPINYGRGPGYDPGAAAAAAAAAATLGAIGIISGSRGHARRGHRGRHRR
jgi:hypothetical protein